MKCAHSGCSRKAYFGMGTIANTANIFCFHHRTLEMNLILGGELIFQLLVIEDEKKNALEIFIESNYDFFLETHQAFCIEEKQILCDKLCALLNTSRNQILRNRICFDYETFIVENLGLEKFEICRRRQCCTEECKICMSSLTLIDDDKVVICRKCNSTLTHLSCIRIYATSDLRVKCQLLHFHECK